MIRGWLAGKLRQWAWKLQRPAPRTIFDDAGDAIAEVIGRGFRPVEIHIDPESYHNLAEMLISVGVIHLDSQVRFSTERQKAEGRLPMNLFGVPVHSVVTLEGAGFYLAVIVDDPCLGDCDEDDEGRKINPITLEPCP